MRYFLSIATGLLMALVFAWSLDVTASGENKKANWDEILGESKAAIPTPDDSVARSVYRNWSDAAAAAKKSGFPIVAEFRCPRIKNVPSIEKMLAEGGEVSDLLRNFVRLELDDVSEVDTRIFPFPEYQDLDKAWWLWFLEATGVVYGVFGGPDAAPVDVNLTPSAIAKTLKRVLEYHFDPRRPDWKLDGKAPEAQGKQVTIIDMNGFRSWKNKFGNYVDKAGCVYCHSLACAYNQELFDKKTFDKKNGFYTWQLPENVGLTMSADDPLVVRFVEKGSPADNAGMKQGDVLGAAEGKRLFSGTDLRRILNSLEHKAVKLELVWLRDGEVKSAELSLPKDWYIYDVGWRRWVAIADIGGRCGFNWSQRVNEDGRARFKIADDAMCIKPVMGRNPATMPAYKAGLRPEHTIVAVNGKSPDVWGNSFVVWFKLNFDTGDKIDFKVLDAKGKTSAIKFKAE